MSARSGLLLGRVLVEQCGESLLGVVEELRRIFIQHREHRRRQRADASSPSKLRCNLDFKDPLLNQARNIIAGLTIEEAHRVTKAFAIYFELTNLAETTHRKRRRRAAKLHPEQPALEGSFRGTLKRMRAAGISVEQALDVLRKIKVVPVFTAHPTEVARRTVLLKRRRIAKQLERLDRLPLTDADASRFESLIFAEVTSLWQTDEVRLEKPLVTDEIRMGLDHYPFSLFAALPRIYDELADSFRQIYDFDIDGSRPASTSFFRLLDRRRPRRQSVRHSGLDARSVAAGAEYDHRPLHRGTGARRRPTERFFPPGTRFLKRFESGWRITAPGLATSLRASREFPAPNFIVAC